MLYALIDGKKKNCILQPVTDIFTAGDIAGCLLKLRTLGMWKVIDQMSELVSEYRKEVYQEYKG